MYLISHPYTVIICDIKSYQPSFCVTMCLFVIQNMQDIITKIAQNHAKFTFSVLLAFKPMKVFRLPKRRRYFPVIFLSWN